MAKEIQPAIIYRKDSSGYAGFIHTKDYSRDFSLSPGGNVLHYGKSGFEGILAVPNVDGNIYVVTLDENIDRMVNTMYAMLFMEPPSLEAKVGAARRLFPDVDRKMAIPREKQRYLKITKDEIKNAILETVKRNIAAGYLDPTQLIYVRPNFYRGDTVEDGISKLKFGVASLANEVVLEISAVNVQSYLASAPPSGARLLVFDRALLPDEVKLTVAEGTGVHGIMRGIKSGSNYGVAKDLALYYGFDEALLVDVKCNVTEGAGENVFAARGRELWTPPVTQPILPGTKRNIVIEMAQNIGFPVIQEPISLDEFIESDAVGLSGTWCGFEPPAVVAWMREDADKPGEFRGKKSNYDPNNPLITKIRDEYRKLIKGDTSLDNRLKGIQNRIRLKVA